MLEGAALFVVLWWAWAGYVWLTNAVPAEEVIPARLVILIAMAAMLVTSLAVPDAFGEYGVLFGLAYFVVRLLHVVLFVLASSVPPEAIRAMLRLAPGFLGAPLLLIPAGFADGFVQGALWAAAIGIDLSVSLVGGVGGFRVHAGHFAERFALIIIIALGESIVSIGVGASGLALGAGVVLASVLGVALAAALWWAYFDLFVLVAERRLFAAMGEGRGLRGTPTPTCTCRWWPGSSSSPWASSKPWPTSGIHSEPSRPWRCAEGSPYTCLGTTV